MNSEATKPTTTPTQKYGELNFSGITAPIPSPPVNTPHKDEPPKSRKRLS